MRIFRCALRPILRTTHSDKQLACQPGSSVLIHGRSNTCALNGDARVRADLSVFLNRYSLCHGTVAPRAATVPPTGGITAASGVQGRRVMAQMIAHERADEVITVVVARLHAQVQRLPGLARRGFE